ncbi:MAG: hypothetical protein QOI64_684 [Solirubrobacteraceae bacterium]|jgi:divalent metal cation (Fe/Co/Zn/Cd) transporter|nr:hypothetical protein [Solirubrobacteraceae bacterium]
MTMRSFLRTGESAALLVALFAGALMLWIGVPIAWLYIGSLVQQATNSVGAALGLMLVGAVVTIGVVAQLLGRVNEGYEHLREARGLDSTGQVPLEAALTLSALVALVLFVVWILFLAGTAPLPVPDGSG